MSKRTERLKTKQRLILTFLLIVAGIVIYKLAGYPLRALISNRYYFNLASESVLAACAVLSAWYLHRMNIYRFKFEGFKTGLMVLAIPGFAILGLLKFSFQEGNPVLVSAPEAIAFFVEMLLVGVAEETQFRGLLQNAMHDYFGEKTLKDKYFAIIGSGALFGLTHLINVFSGMSLWGTFCQAMGVIPIGVLFCAAYYRSNRNLWAVILIHGGMDFAAMLHSGYLRGLDQVAIVDSKYNDVFPWQSILVYIAIDIWVLWPSKMRETGRR